MKMPHISRAPKVSYHLHNRPSVVTILSQMNPVRPDDVFQVVIALQVPSHISLQPLYTQHKFDHNTTW